MTSDHNQDPRRRMRRILADEELEKTAEHNPSPLSRLPRARPAGEAAPPPPAPAPVYAAPPAPAPQRFSGFHFGPAFWTVTGLLSLFVNGVLVAVVIYLLTSTSTLQSNAGAAGFNILSGLYTNFEKMDRANIDAQIPVSTEIDIGLDVPFQQTTTITLASDATISNARVRITSPALNIDAPAEVILPAGTSLNVAISTMVRVQDKVPVNLTVPVHIPLSQTELHEPFTGLQDVIQPWYCLLQPAALNLDGQPICR